MLEAIDAGLWLRREEGDILRAGPEALLSERMKRELIRRKYHIMGLLVMRFLIVYSKTLEATIFFAEDELVRNILIEAGAEPGSIYSLNEVAALSKANLQSVISAKELCVLHQAKETFNGRFTE